MRCPRKKRAARHRVRSALIVICHRGIASTTRARHQFAKVLELIVRFRIQQMIIVAIVWFSTTDTRLPCDKVFRLTVFRDKVVFGRRFHANPWHGLSQRSFTAGKNLNPNNLDRQTGLIHFVGWAHRCLIMLPFPLKNSPIFGGTTYSVSSCGIHRCTPLPQGEAISSLMCLASRASDAQVGHPFTGRGRRGKP